MSVDEQGLKVGIVCYPTVGGSGVVATEIALHAARRGCEVHLISYDRPARLQRGIPGLRYHTVQVSAYPLFRHPPYAIALATRMLEVQEEAGVDLFHVHYAIPHAVSAFLADQMSARPLRFITTLHGTDITVVGTDRAYTRPTRFALERSDAITAVSQWLADETMLTFGSKQPIEVIPNFIDPEQFQPSERVPFHARPDQERRIVHASNLRPVKRVADVVRAFARIAAQVPSRLTIAGDGPDRDHAVAVAADLGVADRVETLGAIDGDRLAELFAGTDLFLSASETESFGLSMLEAMSAGVPCVSSDVGGVGEVFGGTGALVPLGDYEAMADAAIELLADDQVHARACLEARARAVEQFSCDVVVDRYLDLYRRTLNS